MPDITRRCLLLSSCSRWWTLRTRSLLRRNVMLTRDQ